MVPDHAESCQIGSCCERMPVQQSKDCDLALRKILAGPDVPTNLSALERLLAFDPEAYRLKAHRRQRPGC